MIDDCYPENQQQQFLRGLEAFDEQARDQYGKSFRGLRPARPARRPGFSHRRRRQNSHKTDDLSFFFRENKNLVIRGYLGSQYFLTKIEVYELVPGRWHGCTPVITKSLTMGDSITTNSFDAIVIGSGMSGGWAAKEFTDSGLKTLVLERGRDVKAHQRLSDDEQVSLGIRAPGTGAAGDPAGQPGGKPLLCVPGRRDALLCERYRAPVCPGKTL
jgi:hypothetical protein